VDGLGRPAAFVAVAVAAHTRRSGAVLLIVYIVHIWLKICHMVLYCIRNIDIV
jgi:hypothetical protein